MPKVNDCTECKRFLRCEKNSEEWDNTKARLYVDPKHLGSNERLSQNEKQAIAHMNAFAKKCEEAIV